MRIWSWARVRKAANVAMKGTNPLAARPMPMPTMFCSAMKDWKDRSGKASKNLSA